MIVGHQTLEWLFLVANFVTEEFKLEEVQVIHPFFIENGLLSLEALSKGHRYFMMVWLNEKGIPLSCKVVIDDVKVVDKKFDEESLGI